MTKSIGRISLIIIFAILISCFPAVSVSVSGAVDCPGNNRCSVIIDLNAHYLYSGTPGLSVQAFSECCSCVVDADDDFIICTGTPALLNGEAYTIIVSGDCAADGMVDSTDVITLKMHLLNINKLEGVYAAAVSFENGEEPGSTDYIRLKRYILGLNSELYTPETYVIPDFTGKTKSEALDLAFENELAPSVYMELADGKEPNRVFEQSIAPGKYILTDNSIAFKIALEDTGYKPLNYDVMKAMWLSQFDMTNAYSTGSEQRSETEYRSRVETICKNFANNGFNTAIIQVRPNGDSFYPSEIYTPSYYVTGSYKNDFTYDPFAIFIEIAHSYDISVHGWLNPLRLMSPSSLRVVNKKYRLGEWYQNSSLRSKYLFYNKEITDTNYYYLNPAYEEVRQMIIDGAVEMCEKYDVDGVHFDDYFYPTSDASFDSAAYDAMGGGLSLSRFRMNNINALVSGMYAAIKEVDPRIVFGISPAGNIGNNRGYLSADIDTWGSTEGYVDYLMPQLYWGFEYSWDYAKYEYLIQEWKKITSNESVKLIPGLPFYKARSGATSGSDGDEWTRNKDVLKRMIEKAEYYGASGFAGFSYTSFFSDSTGALNSDTAQEARNLFAAMKNWN